jgi:hypothetical protein
MRVTPAIETIYYQNKDTYPEQLETLIQAVMDAIDQAGYKSDIEVLDKCKKIPLISAAIQNRFGFIAEIVTKKIYTGNIAAVYTPVSVQMADYTVFDLAEIANKELRGYIEKSSTMLLSEEIQRSVVNFKMGKVSGYYSKIRVYINLDFYTLYKKVKLSAKEIVSVLMHEIGHIFVGFSYHYRVNQLNLNTAVVVDELNKNNVEKAVYLLNNNVKSKEDYLTLKSDTKVRYDIAFACAQRYVDLSLEYRYLYTLTNNESMADNFAVRFNLGRELVGALEKMNVYIAKEYGVANFMATKAKADVEGFSFVMETVLVSFTDIFVGIFGRLYAATIAPILLLFSDSFFTYDNTYDRYKRIKIAIINNLKTISHDRETQKRLIAQLDYIDGQLKTYKKDSENGVVTDLLLTLFIPKYRQMMRFKSLQNNIEDLLNSDILYLTTKLKTI